MIKNKIDLAYHTPFDFNQVEWELGNQKALHGNDLYHSFYALQSLVKTTKAEYVLFWDFSLGIPPSPHTLNELTSKKVDAWHAGLKMGLHDAIWSLNYVHPLSVFNLDAADDIESSSFKMSLRACLIKTVVLQKINYFDFNFSTYDSAGIDLGYTLLKKGGIVRYSPKILSQENYTSVQITKSDQFKFINKHFGKKWLLWSCLQNFKETFNPFQSIKLYLKNNQKNSTENNLKINDSPKAIKNFSEEPLVSILVPTLDRYTYIINQLSDIDNLSYKNIEVLITDQTNKENRNEEFYKNFKNINIKYFPQNGKGQCLAWNKLIDEAEGKYLLFLGDDADEIRNDFINSLMTTLKFYDADMVASHVIEVGVKSGSEPKKGVSMTHTFPITLIKRDLVIKAGKMDMFFNLNARADKDLLLRCHLKGALMLYDYEATILHHRAPAGGLRHHKARVITRNMSKNKFNKITIPTYTEFFIGLKYFQKSKLKLYISIRKFSFLFISGNIFKKFLRILYLLLNYIKIILQIKKNMRIAENGLKKEKQI